MIKNEISTAVVRRLPRYYRYLGELLESGIERISFLIIWHHPRSNSINQISSHYSTTLTIFKQTFQKK